MSKNISILQDSEEKTLKKVEKIKTQLANGNACYWVPEDEYPLGVLTVTEDGVYYPSTDPNGPYYGYSEINVSGIGTTTMGQLADIVITKNGTYESSTDSSGPYYGYAKVTVNVSGSGDDGSGGGGDGGSSSPTITGKDADGDDAIVGTDEDGNIVSEKLPTRISINVYPNNLVYEDGQTIIFTGLRVKAFLPDDTEWGIVDDNELIKPVTVAASDLDGIREEYTIEDKSILSHPNDLHLPLITESALGSQSDNIESIITVNTGLLLMINDMAYCFSKTPATLTMVQTIKSTGKQSTYTTSTNASVKTRVSEIQVHYVSNYAVPAGFTRIGTNNTVDFSGGAGGYVQYMRDIATILFDGNRNQSSQQTIPLQWKRPGDKKVLETSFTIAVHGSDDSGSGTGPAPTPSPG